MHDGEDSAHRKSGRGKHFAIARRRDSSFQSDSGIMPPSPLFYKEKHDFLDGISACRYGSPRGSFPGAGCNGTIMAQERRERTPLDDSRGSVRNPSLNR